MSPRALAAPGLADRLHRLGRAGDRAGRPGRHFHRRPLHAGRSAPRSTPRPFEPHQILSEPPSRGSPTNLRQGRQARLRSLAADGRRPRPLRRACRARRRQLRAGRDQSRRRRVAATARRPRWRPCYRMPVDFAGEASEPQARPHRRSARRQGRRRRPASPRPISIAWLLNVRGGDVPRTPFAAGLRPAACRRPCRSLHGPPQAARTAPVRGWATPSRSRRPTSWAGALDKLGQDGQARPGRNLRRRPTGRRHACRRAGADVVRDADPCALPKACKNDGRTRGHPRRPSPRRRGAVSSFLAWLAREIARAASCARSTSPTACEALRQETGELPRPQLRHDLGRRRQRRHRPLPRRTVRPNARSSPAASTWWIRAPSTATAPPTSPAPSAIGTPTPEMRDRFTRVLKGHIALATARFPVGTTGSQLDAAGALRAVAGRPRLRSRHRPRRRRLSLGPRGPAPHLQDAQSGRPAAGHDRQQRARLLQGRRLRHPHREPGRREGSSRSTGADRRYARNSRR